MDLDTNLRGRLRNTKLAQHDGLFPIFEAVVNSIHSLEEKEDFSTTGEIVLTIRRDNQLDLTKKKPNIIGFDIEDNGIGFSEDNMKSFKTLDSEHKIDKGCKGIGRLLWLKAFGFVKIESELSALRAGFQFSAYSIVSWLQLGQPSTGMQLLHL